MKPTNDHLTRVVVRSSGVARGDVAELVRVEAVAARSQAGDGSVDEQALRRLRQFQNARHRRPAAVVQDDAGADLRVDHADVHQRRRQQPKRRRQRRRHGEDATFRRRHSALFIRCRCLDSVTVPRWR